MIDTLHSALPRALRLTLLFAAELVLVMLAFQLFATLECRATSVEGACRALRGVGLRGVSLLVLLAVYFWAVRAAWQEFLRLAAARSGGTRWVALHVAGLMLIILPMALVPDHALNPLFHRILPLMVLGGGMAALGGLFWLAGPRDWRQWLRPRLVPVLALVLLAALLPNLAEAIGPIWYWETLTQITFAGVALMLALVADVPVGCYLSGGIDSCSILGLAAAVNQTPVKAFTIGFDDSRYDETDIAKEMAEATGAEQDVMRLSGDDLYDHFETTLWHTERTIYNTLGVAKYLMSRHVRHVNYKVVLTGEGSDELFAGYPAFRRDMFLHGSDGGDQDQSQKRLDQANALVTGAMLAAKPVDDPHLTATVGFTPSCLQPWLACAPLVPGLLASERREAMAGYEPGKAIAATLDRSQLDERHVLDRAQYVWIKTMLEGQILTWGGDRVDMANSMEARPPFLDHHLAAVAVQVPPDLRIKDQREKHVLREAVAGLLPERLYHREKFAFMAPPAHADEEKLQKLDQLVAAHLSREAIETCGLLDPEGVAQLLERHRNPETPAAEKVQLDAMVNHLLGVQILHKLFVQTDVPAQARQAADARGWHVSEPAQVF